MFDYDVSSGEIFLYDEIGPEWMGMIDAGSVIKALSEMDYQRVTVRINSPGGSVDEGVAIYNALDRYKGGVDTINDSVAASIANLIYMAGEQRLTASNAKSMIHSPWTIALGNAAELRKTADVLDVYGASIKAVYVAKLGKTDEEITALMDAETWYLADAAIESGISTGIGQDIDVEPVKIAFGRFRNTPKDLLKTVTAGTKTPYPHNRIAAEIKQKRNRVA